jgi:uncharacterized protein (TIGR00290 family)
MTTPEPPDVRPRLLLSWSSGKDAAWCLHTLQQSQEYEIAGLLTTINAEFDRVAMHAVRRTLLEAQVEAVGLPLLIVPIPWPCSNAEYEAAMARALQRARDEWNITHIAFGDLYLEDVRAYRESSLAETGLIPVFPIWGRPTHALAEEMIAAGLKARLTCVDPRRLPAKDVGRMFDGDFLSALPADVDPCGESGEFHSFAFDGPMFHHPVAATLGEIVERDGFLFADLLPE